MKIDPYEDVAQSLDFGNYAGIRGGSIPGEGASNNSGVIEHLDFLAFGRYVFGTLGNDAKLLYYI